MVGMAEVGAPISQDGVQSIRTVGAPACDIFSLLRKMANKDMTFEYHPMGAPTCLCKQEAEEPSGNAAQPCARAQAQGYINDDLKADGLRKGWSFRVGTWNVDSLIGRAGEVVEALSDRKVDVACIQEHTHNTQHNTTVLRLCGICPGKPG